MQTPVKGQKSKVKQVNLFNVCQWSKILEFYLLFWIICFNDFIDRTG